MFTGKKAVEATKAWRLANPDKLKKLRETEKANRKLRRKNDSNYGKRNSAKNRKYNLQKIGSSPEHYEKQYQLQNGCCKICGRYEEQLVVDHCHRLNTFRGLLCPQCNCALGLFYDEPETCRKAAIYLDEFLETVKEKH